MARSRKARLTCRQFIQIGRVFRESLQQDIKSVNYNKSAIHQVIAKANDQFHEALDDVEVGIVRSHPF